MTSQVDPESFDRVWKFVTEIGVNERHFNDLQARYRYLASTWLLAVFAASGFLLTQELTIAVAKELLVAGISFAGAIGILLLWILDVLVYHRLLDSCFVEGYSLEEKCRWLPQIRHNMKSTQFRGSVVYRIAVFWIASTVIPLLMSGASLILWMGSSDLLLFGAAFFLTLFLSASVGFIIYRQSKPASIAD